MTQYFIENQEYYVRTEFADYDGYYHLPSDRFVFLKEEYDQQSRIVSVTVRVAGRRVVSFRLHDEKQKYILDKPENYFSMNRYGVGDFLSAYNKHRFDIKGMYAETSGSVQDESGRGLYHIAAKYADRWAVEYLRDCKIPLAADKNGRTPLHELADTPLNCDDPANAEAVYKTALELVEAGDNPEKSDKYDVKAFARAAEHGMISFIQAMADKGVQMDAALKDGQNLLHVLSRMQHLSEAGMQQTCNIIRILLDTQTFDISAEDIYGCTPLEYAQRGGNKQIAVLFTGDSDAAVTGGMDLCRAVETDDMDAVQALLQSGEDVNQPDEKERTPLMIAVSEWRPHRVKVFQEPKKYEHRQDFDMIKLLLENGGDVNYRTGRSEETVLFGLFDVLANEESLPILHLFIEHGLDVNLPVDNWQNTALMTVCLNYTPNFRYRLVEILLEVGADVNQKNSRGFTTLHRLATSREDVSEIARLLIGRGADINCKTDQGETPLMLAAQNPVGGYNIAGLLLRNKCDADAVSDAGKSALQAAIDFGNDAVAKLLIKQ